MLSAVIDVADASQWEVMSPPDLPSPDTLFAEVARALVLAHHGRSGKGSGVLRRFIPRDVEEFRADTAARQAVGRISSAAPAPDASVYRVLAFHLVEEVEVTSAWRGLWQRSHGVRELGRRRPETASYDSSDPEDEFRKHQVPAVGRVVAALGLGALDRLQPHDENHETGAETRRHDAEALWRALYAAAVDEWMTDRIERGFWAELVVILARRRWSMVRTAATNAGGAALRALVEPLVGLDRTFLAVVATLHRDGAGASDLVNAVAACGADLAAILDQAHELRRIDPRQLDLGDAAWSAIDELCRELDEQVC
jgi:hypothetical protein